MTTISGRYPEDSGDFTYPEADGDLKLLPDLLDPFGRSVGESDPTAQVICDLVTQDGEAAEFQPPPRNVLKRGGSRLIASAVSSRS